MSLRSWIPKRSAIALLVALLASAGQAAAGADALYRARTIVTGQGEENRSAGLAKALEMVLVKLSGDPSLLRDSRLGAIAPSPLVEEFSYRDRMEGIPVHDEQGTRDRPYDLTVDFRPDRIDALLGSLGRAVWPADARPPIAVFVEVDTGALRYVLAADGARGRDQREALAAAAEGLGLQLILPAEAGVAAAGLRAAAAGAAGEADLLDAARVLGGEVALAGALRWSERSLGWTAEWRLVPASGSSGWGIAGVSFDEAFRNALGGAAGILSRR